MDIYQFIFGAVEKGGLFAYAAVMTLMWYMTDKERKSNAKTYAQNQKDWIEALKPLETIANKSLTLLEILTRGRQ